MLAESSGHRWQRCDHIYLFSFCFHCFWHSLLGDDDEKYSLYREWHMDSYFWSQVKNYSSFFWEEPSPSQLTVRHMCWEFNNVLTAHHLQKRRANREVCVITSCSSAGKLSFEVHFTFEGTFRSLLKSANRRRGCLTLSCLIRPIAALHAVLPVSPDSFAFVEVTQGPPRAKQSRREQSAWYIG